MKVNLIAAKNVRDFAQQHASSIKSFEEWIVKVENADWDRAVDIYQTFASKSVDLLGMGSERVVFDIGGNNYRVICSYYFNESVDTATFFVKWVGTHAEYDRLCDNNKQYTVEIF